MPLHSTLTPKQKEREMKQLYLSMSLFALLSLTLGCSNEAGDSFGETGMENPIVEDAGPPPNDQTPDASTANNEQIPPELPLVDPDCPSLRLMEFKSAELGPEGGKINLAFTELHIPKKFLNEKTKITIARYGMSEKASFYDYYIILPENLKSHYYKFDISIYTGRNNDDFYEKDNDLGYIHENDFWSASATQTNSTIGYSMGFFRRFGKIGFRKNIRQKSNLCPTDENKKTKSTSTNNDVPPGQNYIGKCFEAEYKLTTEGCENYGAICHKGLAGNFLCESCIVKSVCGDSSSLQCCHTCETDPDMQRDFPCSETTLSLVSEDIECFIHEYFISCSDFQEGKNHLGGLSAETKVKCYSTPKIDMKNSTKNGQTCVVAQVTDVTVSPTTILTYPKIVDLSNTCDALWPRFDCELRKHEEEHYRIGMSACENSQISLTGIVSSEHCSDDPKQAEDVAIQELDALYKKEEQNLYRSGQTEQDDFDVRTKHGDIHFACSC